MPPCMIMQTTDKLEYERNAEFAKRSTKTSENEYAGRVYPAFSKVPYTIEDSVIAERRAEAEKRAGIAAKQKIEVRLHMCMNLSCKTQGTHHNAHSSC